MKTRITQYELINGTRSEKKKVNHEVETVGEVKAFKKLVYEKEQKDPDTYDVVFWFEGIGDYTHLLHY